MIRISGALVFLCTGATKPLKRTPQNCRLSLKKPLKIVDYVFFLRTKNAPKISKKICENIKVRPFFN